MVLALTAEEPDTVAEIQGRLSDLFLSAAFPKSSAHGALPRLEEKGYVRRGRGALLKTRAEAKACQAAAEDVHQKMLTEQRRRIATRRKPNGLAEEVEDELSNAHLIDVKLGWEDIAARRRKLADRLEKIYQRFDAREQSLRSANPSPIALHGSREVGR